MTTIPQDVQVVIAVVAVLVLLASFKLWARLFGMVTIPDDAIGIVYKKWVLFGSNRSLPDGHVVALRGEPGLQATTLAPGVHFRLWPWQYSVTKTKFTSVPSGKIGLVEAIDGAPLSAGQVLGRYKECDLFQNVAEFMANGGQRGPQLCVLPPGLYRINTGVFKVTTADQTIVKNNMVGIVTTKEGKSLPTTEIAGAEIDGHNSFQDADAFVDKGGFKGLQEQVILAGKYNLSPLFCSVEEVPMTTVPIAHVGVVISYVGKTGKDLTGDEFEHGNLVSRGERGVWIEPYDPGRYPINPYTHKVEMVPTANVVLNWATGKTEAHMLDKDLCTITVRSKDGFKFNLDVSQIIHVPRKEAPKVIARFGSMQNLVTQVLEPTIGNYFRNSAQDASVIEFLQERSKRQEAAKTQISGALKEYNVGAEDTLIGDITPPEELMKPLTQKKVAETEQATYAAQKITEETRKTLQQARAEADTQASVVTAQRKVEISTFDASASVERSKGDAKSKTIQAEADANIVKIVAEAEANRKTIAAKADANSKTVNAQADADVTRLNGEADAARAKAVGSAEAEVIKMKTAAMDADKYAIVQVAQALANAKQPLVPAMMAGGNGGGSVIDMLLATQLKAIMPVPGAKESK